MLATRASIVVFHQMLSTMAHVAGVKARDRKPDCYSLLHPVMLGLTDMGDQRCYEAAVDRERQRIGRMIMNVPNELSGISKLQVGIGKKSP
ncbi:hypothetical protein NL676_036183 [Syzygium grande]|nr:hypothetical protein NL676_036183 [Syzygium grande]